MGDDITRHELDAKLELVEARMDTRLAKMETVVERIGEDLKSITKASGNFKYWAIGTAIATVVGLYAANISLVQTIIAAFESGRSQAQQTQPASQPSEASKRDQKR